MASATKKLGFGLLTCPLCGSSGENQDLCIDLNALDRVCCGDCGDTFTPQQAIDKLAAELAAWEKIARMMEFGRELANE